MMEIALAVIVAETLIIIFLAGALTSEIKNNKFWSDQYKEMKERYFEILDKVTDKWR